MGVVLNHCGNLRAEPGCDFSIYQSVFVQKLTFGHELNVRTKRINMQTAKMKFLHKETDLKCPVDLLHLLVKRS